MKHLQLATLNLTKDKNKRSWEFKSTVSMMTNCGSLEDVGFFFLNQDVENLSV